MPDDDVAADRYLAAERRADRGRACLVRGVQLGPRRGRAVPAQPALLARRRLVGARARARTATSAACAGGTSSTRPPTRPAGRRARRPGTAREVLDRGRAARRGRMLRLRLADGLPLDRLTRGRAGRPRRGARATGCWSRGGSTTGRAVLTLRGRLLADACRPRDLPAARAWPDRAAGRTPPSRPGRGDYFTRRSGHRVRVQLALVGLHAGDDAEHDDDDPGDQRQEEQDAERAARRGS